MANPSRLPSRRAPAGRNRPISMIEGSGFGINSLTHKELSEHGATSKQAKRRSLLPQFTRKTSGDQSIRADDIPEDNAVGSDTVSMASSGEDEPRKAMEEQDRRMMPPPTSRLSRPASVFGAGVLGRAPSVRSGGRDVKVSDARADALAALTGSAPQAATSRTFPQESSLGRTPSTRLPQSPSVRGLSRSTSVRTKDGPARASSLAKPAGSSTVETRSSVTGKPRPPSIDGKSAGRPPSVASQTSPKTSTATRQANTRPQSIAMAPPARPTFNTFQQHYSPAKSALPKPPIPSTRASKPAVPAAAPAAEEPDFETLKQQIELLQLSLLHQAACQTSIQFDTSAKRRLSAKQARLKKDYEALRELEGEQLRIAHLAMLDAWCPDTALLVEHLHVLSKLYAELTSLTDSGRYTNLVGSFERWMDEATAALTGQSAAFIEALPQDWHKVHTSLALRCRALQRDLSTLPPAPSVKDSSVTDLPLGILLETCEHMLDGMLKELELMSKLEREILRREKVRLDKDVEALTLDVAANEKWVPAWQSVA